MPRMLSEMKVIPFPIVHRGGFETLSLTNLEREVVPFAEDRRQIPPHPYLNASLPRKLSNCKYYVIS
jgi:hypothetical protein